MDAGFLFFLMIQGILAIYSHSMLSWIILYSFRDNPVANLILFCPLIAELHVEMTDDMGLKRVQTHVVMTSYIILACWIEAAALNLVSKF